MISHEYRCIFVHIPKCAGTSIEHALGHFDAHTGRGGQDHRSVRMICQPPPALPSLFNKDNAMDYVRRVREQYRTHANPANAVLPSVSEYQSYFKFTFVRHPLARALSWYKNALRDPIHQKNYGIDPSLSFDAFIRKFAGKGFLRPQTYWLKDYRGQIPMDFIGKFERLADDYKTVCSRLGIDAPELPHKIEAQKTQSTQSVDDKTIAFINDFYAEDMDLFGYSLSAEP